MILKVSKVVTGTIWELGDIHYQVLSIHSAWAKVRYYNTETKEKGFKTMRREELVIGKELPF